MEQQTYQPIPQNAVQPPNANIPATPFVAQQTPTNMARTPTTLNAKKGMSKGAKVGIGLGVAALIGTGAYFLFRDKDDKPKVKSKPKKASQKKTLGAIEFS